MNNEFWSGKKVFVTYPATFRGAWLILFLQSVGAQVFGYGPNAPRSPHLFDLANVAETASISFGSLQDLENLKQALQFAEADVVIHLGPESSFRDALAAPAESFAEAVVGTANLLEALRETGSVRALVCLSSDKVYSRSPGQEVLSEAGAVSAGEIGPTAKLCAEFVALSYRNSFFSPDKFNKHKLALAVARVGGVQGGGDFTPEGFVFQAVQAFREGEPFAVKNPRSQRPWFSVLDEVQGLLLLAEALFERGPKAPALVNLAAMESAEVGWVAELLAKTWGEGARVDLADNGRGPSRHDALDMGLAMQELSWRPVWGLSEMMEKTLNWYRGFYLSAGDARELCLQDISDFQKGS